jgi:ankyrin repeat protein
MSQKGNIILTAVIDNDTDLLQDMLTMGASINAKDSVGYTALMWATWYGYADTVKLLLDSGADVNVKNNIGDTALAIAKEKEIVDLLESAGATT